jgi:hypothetical protein
VKKKITRTRFKLCQQTRSDSLTCQTPLLRRLLEVSVDHWISYLFLVTAKANEGVRLDKDVATAIHKGLNSDPDLLDECAGWHVIVGKSYASAITYQTKNVLFFDLLGDVHKTFLIFKT